MKRRNSNPPPAGKLSIFAFLSDSSTSPSHPLAIGSFILIRIMVFAFPPERQKISW
jgi:hypothetical protein